MGGTRPSSDVTNFGKANVAVRAYLRELRNKYTTLSITDRAALVTPQFLDATPLGTEKQRGGGTVTTPYPLIERSYIPRVWQ